MEFFLHEIHIGNFILDSPFSFFISLEKLQLSLTKFSSRIEYFLNERKFSLLIDVEI